MGLRGLVDASEFCIAGFTLSVSLSHTFPPFEFSPISLIGHGLWLSGLDVVTCTRFPTPIFPSSECFSIAPSAYWVLRGLVSFCKMLRMHSVALEESLAASP
jgi:hypothetical protein